MEQGELPRWRRISCAPIRARSPGSIRGAGGRSAVHATERHAEARNRQTDHLSDRAVASCGESRGQKNRPREEIGDQKSNLTFRESDTKTTCGVASSQGVLADNDHAPRRAPGCVSSRCEAAGPSGGPAATGASIAGGTPGWPRVRTSTDTSRETPRDLHAALERRPVH